MTGLPFLVHHDAQDPRPAGGGGSPVDRPGNLAPGGRLRRDQLARRLYRERSGRLHRGHRRGGRPRPGDAQAAVLAALVLAAQDGSGNPTSASTLLLPAIAGVIVAANAITGGVSSVVRAVIGGPLSTVIEIGIGWSGQAPPPSTSTGGAGHRGWPDEGPFPQRSHEMSRPGTARRAWPRSRPRPRSLGRLVRRASWTAC